VELETLSLMSMAEHIWICASAILVRSPMQMAHVQITKNVFFFLAGSMFGHSPDVLVQRAKEQLSQGLTMMLPTEVCDVFIRIL
jgi:hypothetical protein